MRISKRRILVIFLLVFSSSAAAGEYKEHTVVSKNSYSTYISLGCVEKKIQIAIHWNTNIGTVGKYRRHLVLPGNLGNTHILLKVLKDQTSTGIIDNDQQAKSFIKLIIQNIKTDYMFIEVFPEGRDEVTGEWESGKYDYKAFLSAVGAVAKECNWDIAMPITKSVRTVNPGAPYDD